MSIQDDSNLKKTEKLDDVIDDFVKKQSWRKNLLVGKAVSSYNSIKDPIILNNSRALHVIENELYINVKSPIYANQLSFRSQSIISYINKQIGKRVLKKLRFQVGSVERADNKSQDEEIDPIIRIELNNDDKKILDRVLSPVSDNDIKSSLNKLFSSALKNRKR